MESLFEKNIALFRKHDLSAYNRLMSLSDETSIEVLSTKDGNAIPVITKNGRPISVHSKYAPHKEAARLIAEVKTRDFDLFIIFGFGFAYHIQELRKQVSPDAVIMVLEKSPAMIKKTFEHRDLSDLLADQNVILVIDPDDDTIAEALKGKSSHKVSFITHRGSHQVFPEYYNNLFQIAKSYLSTKEVNIATLAKFEKAWTANISRNINVLIGNPGANIFYNKFIDTPAFVIAAGPSLTYSIEFIKENADRAILIAVDTSYRILRENGIEPHFCITVDPQLINARYFEGDSESTTVLVADPLAHPATFRFYKGRKTVSGIVFEMMKWIEKTIGEMGQLAHGGSVSTNAYDFAKQLGAAPVYLFGQDLAFTGGMAHARGSYLDEQSALRITRLFTAEMFNRGQLTALPKIVIPGIRTKNVHTNQKMMIFNAWFEKRKDTSLLNTTWDGARLSGITHVDTDTVTLERIKDGISGRIDHIYKTSLPTPEKINQIRLELNTQSSEMFSELATFTPALEKAVAYSRDLLDLVQAETRNQGKLDYLLKKLSDFDTLIESKSVLKDMIGFTVQRVIHTISEGFDIEDSDKDLEDDVKIAKRSHFLYQGLLEGAYFINKTLEKMIRLLEGQGASFPARENSPNTYY